MDAHDIITRHTLQQLARRVIPWHIPLSDLGTLPHLDTHSPLTACEAFVARIADMPTVRVGEIMAYEPATDTIYMPKRGALPDTSWYALLFHNLVHATGHPTRLAYPPLTTCTPFTAEVLTAEIATTYLCSAVGIANVPADTSLAYQRGWIQALRADPHLLSLAVEAAAWAVVFLLRGKP